MRVWRECGVAVRSLLVLIDMMIVVNLAMIVVMIVVNHDGVIVVARLTPPPPAARENRGVRERYGARDDLGAGGMTHDHPSQCNRGAAPTARAVPHVG